MASASWAPNSKADMTPRIFVPFLVKTEHTGSPALEHHYLD